MPDALVPASQRGPGLPLGPHAWCHGSECRGCRPSREFSAHDDAVRWLQGLASNPDSMLHIRQALSSCGDDPALWRANDQRAIAQLAALLVAGRIRVCGERAEATRFEARRSATSSAAGSSTAVPIGAAIPRSPKATTPSVAEEPPSVELDVDAMVETLRAAARDGVPFCEECARAAAAAGA